MATQLAEAALIDPRLVHEAAARPPATYDSNATQDDDRTTAGQGIAVAMLISVPFWALIAFTIYLLL
ncbi:MAG: hypothetical protein JWQ55_2563 [Rhodopila sp.]|jgi:hypothetical protein|nr:hypothetical protein [Rhodopila sp.]